MEESGDIAMEKVQDTGKLKKNKYIIRSEVKTLDTYGVPIDKGWAWMTVLGCFGIHVFLVGGAKSLGVLIVEIRDHFNDISAKEMGLVQGLLITLTVGLGLVANLLSARFTCRAVVFLGGLLAFLGFTLTAFVNEFWMVFLTYCIITGIGFALAYSPSIVFVGSHFKERRSLANGLSLAGSGVGSFILPNVMRVMLNEYGLPGCCMLMGALMLHISVCSLLFRPHANYRKYRCIDSETSRLNAFTPSTENVLPEETPMLERQELALKKCVGNENSRIFRNNTSEHNENKILIQGTEYEQKNGLESKCEAINCYDSHAVVSSKTNSDVRQRLLQVAVDGTAKEQHHEAVTETKMKKSDKSLFEWSLLTNPVFFLYFLFAFFVNVGYPNIFFMLPVHAENEGEDRDSAALILSFVGVTDLLGRIFIGWFSDLKLIERRYLLVSFAFISGSLSLMMPLFNSFEGLAAYAILYGFCAGSYVTLIPVTVADTLGPEKLASSYGMISMAFAATLIPAPLICGEIRDTTGSWNNAFGFVGTFTVCGSLFPLLQPCFKKSVNKDNIAKEKAASSKIVASKV